MQSNLAHWLATLGIAPRRKDPNSRRVSARSARRQLAVEGLEPRMLLALSGSIAVDARSNVFGAGHASPPGSAPGILPPAIELPPGQGRSVQLSVTGQISFDTQPPGTRPFFGADGAPEQSNVFSSSGIGGIQADTA